VIAESYERIHRSNLIGMGVVPLQFPDGEGVDSLGLTGEEVIDVQGLEQALAAGSAEARKVSVTATRDGADPVEFEALARLDTPNEVGYYLNGGILLRVLRDLR
jgi:aconitate hydratase